MWVNLFISTSGVLIYKDMIAFLIVSLKKLSSHRAMSENPVSDESIGDSELMMKLK